MIKTLEPHQIIVVGTNDLGLHAGGAAKQAWQDFGALMGQALRLHTIQTIHNEVEHED